MGEIKILDMGSASFAQDFADAIGLGPEERLELHGPQFERTDGVEPVANPGDLFNVLRYLPEATLRAIGMQPWDGRLWLFPHGWFDAIPQGYPVECISGDRLKWDRDTCDDDMRFGALAYGIVPQWIRKEASNADQ